MFDTFVHYWWQYLIVAVASALVGSINFSILFSHLFKKTDVRNFGSGNPGTTNMFRVFGLKMGLLTLLFDALKGVSTCLVSYFVFTAFAKTYVVFLPNTEQRSVSRRLVRCCRTCLSRVLRIARWQRRSD